MDSDGPAASDARGRVVMLVDNDVRGDSRVQKAARSAADAGWDVVLLGRARDGGAETFTVGRAEVRLLVTPPASDPTSRASSRASFRGPLKRALKGLGLGEILERGYTRFWQAAMGDRCWRKLQPNLWHFEWSYGPVIDQLRPDIIHAHDFRMTGVAVRAAARARAQGRDVKVVWDAHEFLPGIKPWFDHARWHPAHIAYEREYAPQADAVITVSPTLAQMLREYHHLPELPAVMLNCPDIDHRPDGGGGPIPDLRRLCGIGPDVPLFVYGGTAPQQRGVVIMVEALPQLDGAHVALVVDKPELPAVQEVLSRAEKLGVRHRVHLIGYVPYWQVPAFFSAADVGVIPIHHWPNHEIALIQKFFEYSHARLPVIVSDVKTMAETVRSTGQGEVFRAQDLTSYVVAARAILANPQRYRAAYDKPGLLDGWTWPAQAGVLEEVYRRLLPDRASPANTTDQRADVLDKQPTTAELAS
jgi:glycosyltransferase involved in cell wall biosynthesis